ncbi:tape measure protein [Vibrio natriegens]|uniref:tape measure protein n=1 Tax=Vibrio natriegens TaxID=691 RepID=UPI00390924B7
MARNSRTLSSFTNRVRWVNDLPTWNQLKRDSQRLGKELGGASTGAMLKASRAQEKELIASRTKLAEKLRREDEKARVRAKRQAAKDSKSGFQSAISGLTETSGLKASQTAFAERMRQEDALAKKKYSNQEAFDKKQRQVLKRFVLSNSELRKMSGVEKKILLDKLKQAKTVEELLHLERKLKTQITDRNRKEKSRTRELQRQKNISNDMAKTLAGAFAVAGSGHAVIQTGLTFESLERSMLVTSGSAEKAAENFKFVRSEAMKYGKDLATLTESYVSFQAAAGNKLSQKDMRDLFSGVATYSTALGMSTEKTQRAYVAISQMLGKGTLYSEEVFGQLAEASPGVVTHLVNAAVALGKIDKNLSAIDKERALRQLMQRGQLISSEILPELGRQLTLAANKGGLLEDSLQNSLGTNLTIATNNLKELGNELFSSLKPALLAVTQGFNLLAGEGKGLAKIIGKGLGAAILTATAPFMLLGAAIIDTYTIFKELTGATDSGIAKFATFAATTLGVTFAITRLISGFKLLWNIGSKVIGFFTGSNKAASTMTNGVKGLNAGLRGTVGLFGRLLPLVTAAMAIYESRPDGSLSATSLFGKNKFTTWMDQPISQHLSNTTKTIKDNQKVDVNVHVRSDVDASGNILPIIRTEIDQDRENQMVTFYSNLSGRTN